MSTPVLGREAVGSCPLPKYQRFLKRSYIFPHISPTFILFSNLCLIPNKLLCLYQAISDKNGRFYFVPYDSSTILYTEGGGMASKVALWNISSLGGQPNLVSINSLLINLFLF